MHESGSSEGDQAGAGRRGRSHDAEGSREAILDAGEEVFAQHGFDGARIDAIAKASGYNKSLIFQHFGDKLGLYGAVIRRADEQTRQIQNSVMLELMDEDAVKNAGALKPLLRQYVGWYFDYAVEHPQIIRIFNWEMAEGWQTFAKVLSERDFQDVEDFAPIFARMQKAGIMRLRPAALLQFTSALFTCHVFLAILPLYAVLLPGAAADSPKGLSEAREFIIEFIVSGLLIDPGKKPVPAPKQGRGRPGQRKRGSRP